MNTEEFPEELKFISSQLFSVISENATIQNIPKGTEILSSGNYVKVIPVLLSGIVKVFKYYEEKELLLYYIKPGKAV